MRADGAGSAHDKPAHATEHRLRSLGVARSHPISVDSAQAAYKRTCHIESRCARLAISAVVWSLLLAP
ncbi:hypothetical protein XAXN_13835 [Xanthomonas axonopodis]|uniref:Uncharacterized protein n=1 Tax=Xanthomonas axonopodis TaxID=53413 RepID=A0A0P6VQQ2_9XANT|nr:hypothetical protein XAXN_13835 [Xanthomonas axonopodis]